MQEVVKKQIGKYTIFYQMHTGTNAIRDYLESKKEKNEHYRHRDPDFWVLNKAAKQGVSGVGIDSAEEGKKYLQYGYDKRLGYIKDRFRDKNKKCEGMIKGVRTINDVVGDEVCVPAAIMGIPTCMRRKQYIRKKAKVIRLVVVTGMPHYVTAEDIAKAGANIAIAAKEIERRGNRVEINMAKILETERSNEGCVVATKIKNADQPFDLKRIGFPLCCPAMPRWLMMSWIERADRIPDAGYGHGTPAQHAWGNDAVDMIGKSLFGPHSVVIVQEGMENKNPEELANMIIEEANKIKG
jgi:hypothetical protein